MTCAYFSVSAHVELARAVGGEHLGEGVRHLLLLEDDRAVEVVAVARHRRQVEAGLEEALGQLPRPVGPEVEEDNRVAGLDPRPALEVTGSMNSSVIPASYCCCT